MAIARSKHRHRKFKDKHTLAFVAVLKGDDVFRVSAQHKVQIRATGYQCQCLTCLKTYEPGTKIGLVISGPIFNGIKKNGMVFVDNVEGRCYSIDMTHPRPPTAIPWDIKFRISNNTKIRHVDTTLVNKKIKTVLARWARTL